MAKRFSELGIKQQDDTAVIKQTHDDGSVTAELFGPGEHDPAVTFPTESEILKMTEEEKEAFDNRQESKKPL